MNHTARTAAENLQHIADHWGHLRESLDTAGPGGTWPPARPGAEYLRALDAADSAEQQLVAALAHAVSHPQRLVTVRHHTGQLYYACAFCEHVGEGLAHPVREDRGTQLGEHPAPIRLHIADACRAIEAALVGLADDIASRDAVAPDWRPSDWHRGGEREPRDAPTAARWLLARLGNEPCCPAHDAEWARIGQYAREAANRLDRVLGIGHTSAPLPLPCPWCSGLLVAHMEAGTVMSVTCSTGLVDCVAPVPFDIDRRARVWSSAEQLASLHRALDAAERKLADEEQRAKRADARRRQRAAAKDRTAAA
ncbi:hypothetical protein OIE71_04625 [Streptomyces sp. NBC_01725]|uniref:hypothetical protein n=1 Tax=Streptomyces sp. NBC_01725 TaxID=2975923 RepID=UPI002E2A4008|nr:hypothetical protein [Streptomyces sp. NBC_01725]